MMNKAKELYWECGYETDPISDDLWKLCNMEEEIIETIGNHYWAEKINDGVYRADIER